MKIVLLLLPLLLWAQILKVGDTLRPITLNDQFERPLALGQERLWLIAWDKESTRLLNRYIDAHQGVLQRHHAVMVVDVSQVPSGIFNLFVKPRMASYEHPILLSFDAAYNRTLPYREGSVTVLKLHQGKISDVLFVSDSKALEELLSQ